MFQLEHELQEWAKRFGRMEVMRSSDIEELEQHMRDSISELMTKGLIEEEAFLIATHRVGEPGRLGREFGKVNGGHVGDRRVFWMIAGYLFFEVCRMTVTAVAGVSEICVALVGGDGTMMGYASVGISAFCWLGLVTWLYRSANQNDGQIGRVFGQPTEKVIGIGISIIVVATLLNFFSKTAVARMVPLVDMGQALMISFWANALFAMLIPLAFLFVMLTIRVRMRDAIAAES